MLPVLNTAKGQFQIPDASSRLDPQVSFDPKSKEFRPIRGLNKTIADYGVLALVDHIEKLIQKGERQEGSVFHGLYENNGVRNRWHKTNTRKKVTYGLTSSDARGAVERLSLVKKEGQDTEVRLKSNSMTPNAMSVKIDRLGQVSDLKIDPHILTSINEHSNNLTKSKLYANYQRIFHSLLSEAKWLVAFIDQHYDSGVKSLGDYKLSKSKPANPKKNQGGNYEVTYKMKQDGNEGRVTDGLEVTVNRYGEIIDIYRQNHIAGHTFQIDRANSINSIEENAHLYIFDEKDSKNEIEQRQRHKEAAAGLAELFALSEETRELSNKINEQNLESDLMTINTEEAGFVTIVNVGYKNKFTREKLRSKETLLKSDNMTKLVSKAGLVYCFPKEDERYTQCTGDQRDLVKDFFEYTKMKPGQVALPFSTAKKYGIDNVTVEDVNGEQCLVSSFGNHELRDHIFGKKKSLFTGRKALLEYMQKVGIDVANGEFNKSVYRWGIRANKDELAKVGIIYEEAKDDKSKDKVYLVDIGEASKWESTGIKRMIGNKIDEIKLRNFPDEQFLQTVVKKAPNGRATVIQNEAELRKLLEKLGFEVPSEIKTEEEIQRRLKAKDPEDPMLQYIAQKDSNSLESGTTASGLYKLKTSILVAKRLLKKQGFVAIGEEQDLKKKKCKYLRYSDSKDTYLGIATLKNRFKPGEQDRVDRLKATAEAKGFKPVVIKVKNLNTAKRDAELEISQAA